MNRTGTNTSAFLALNQGKISMDFWNNRYLSSSVLSIGQTYYICVTKTPGNISTTSKIYLNGNEISGTGNSTTSPSIIDAPAVVGRLDSTRYSVSRIMEVQFYNKALSQDEINYNYNKAKSRHNF